MLDYYDGTTALERIKFDITSPATARHWFLRSPVPVPTRSACATSSRTEPSALQRVLRLRGGPGLCNRLIQPIRAVRRGGRKG